MDEGERAGEGSAPGRAGVRLCNLVAQSQGATQGGVQAGSGTHLTGKETEPWEIIYFKLYKSQLPVVERALEIAALMLGSDKSRGYSLEMICADFLAGAALATDGSEQNLGYSASDGLSSTASRQPASIETTEHE